MEWMSPVDSSFLHIENGTTPMHIGGVSIFEGPPPPFEQLRAMVAGKLGLVPRYRQKVRFVPLAAGPPAAAKRSTASKPTRAKPAKAPERTPAKLAKAPRRAAAVRGSAARPSGR